MNIHAIVRGPVGAVARELPAKLYRSTGKQTRTARGELRQVYAQPIELSAQWQSISADALALLDGNAVTTFTRRVYLHASSDPASRPWAQWRPLGRSGDVLEDQNGGKWLVTQVLEDFSYEGWISVLAVLQQGELFMEIEADGNQG